MQGGRGRVDVLVVLTAGLLEPVQPRVGVVFGQPGVWLTVLGQLKLDRGGHFLLEVVEVVEVVEVMEAVVEGTDLHIAVFTQHNPDHFAPEFCLVKVIDCQRGLLGLSHLN